jgi:hypothetical protein
VTQSVLSPDTSGMSTLERPAVRLTCDLCGAYVIHHCPALVADDPIPPPRGRGSTPEGRRRARELFEAARRERETR